MSAHRASRRIVVYGFLLVIALLVAITGTGLYRIQNLSEDLTEVIQARNGQIALMHTMRGVARERSILLQSMMITDDPFIRDELAIEMSAAAAHYIVAREELLTHDIPAGERRLLEQQHSQTQQTATAQNRIAEYLRDEEYAPAKELLFNIALPGQRRAMAMMDEFININRQKNLDSLNATDRAIKQTYKLMFLLGALGVLFSLIIAQIIHRRISNEITLRLEREAELRHNELRERTIRENIIDGLITLDAGGRILTCNNACKTIFGYEHVNLLGKTVNILLPQVLGSEPNSDLSRHLKVWEKRLLGMGREVTGRRLNGESFPAEIDLSKVELDGETVYIVVIRDISEKKAAQQRLQQFNVELERRVEERTEELARTNDKLRHEILERVKVQHELTHLATHDTLTNLPNRSLFNEHLDIALHNAGRHQRTVALLFIDLDGFKSVNDTYGHEAGDRLLQEIGDRMQNCVRREDIVARMGGDEFAVLLGEQQAPTDASMVAHKLISCINKPVELNGQTCHVGASIGIAMFPHSADNTDDLLRLADNAMYTAKSAGKNSFHIHDTDKTVLLRQQDNGSS
ncbi:MAG: diguanylate cyclase [Gammaproteobacteria bacterium]|nr:diguanylate cyclase [Gammaproteobacteria bacterium]